MIINVLYSFTKRDLNEKPEPVIHEGDDGIHTASIWLASGLNLAFYNVDDIDHVIEQLKKLRMMPITEIRVGDVYANPLYADGIEFVVVSVNRGEKMVEVQAYRGSTLKPIGNPFWKSNRDRIFSEHWRVLRGLEEEN